MVKLDFVNNPDLRNLIDSLNLLELVRRNEDHAPEYRDLSPSQQRDLLFIETHRGLVQVNWRRWPKLRNCLFRIAPKLITTIETGNYDQYERSNSRPKKTVKLFDTSENGGHDGEDNNNTSGGDNSTEGEDENTNGDDENTDEEDSDIDGEDDSTEERESDTDEEDNSTATEDNTDEEDDNSNEEYDSGEEGDGNTDEEDNNTVEEGNPAVDSNNVEDTADLEGSIRAFHFVKSLSSSPKSPH